MNPSLLLETDAAQIVFVVVQLGASGILQGAIVEVEERRYEGCHVLALEIRWIISSALILKSELSKALV